MIKQIALPNNKDATHMYGYLYMQEHGVGKWGVPKKEQEIAEYIANAEAELNSALSEGYSIVSQYPIDTGINLILYKPDEVEESDTPLTGVQIRQRNKFFSMQRSE